MNLKEMSTSVLMHLENDIRRELSYRKYHEGYKQGQFDASMDSVAKITTVSPQQKRDAIVEQAKNDVADLKITNRDLYEVTNGADLRYPNYCNAEFIVNAEKRTVVALLRGHRSGLVRAKGIAKCAPTDCFNAHIGRAISLRRALGLDVPAEYLSAPQPTEVRVGDYVDLGIPHSRELVSATEHESLRNIIGLQCAELWHREGVVKIIDDTRGVDSE